MDKGEDFLFEKEICSRLRRLMNKKNMGQRELAQFCADRGYSITQSALSKILTGKQRLMVWHLEMFSSVLEVPLESLLSDREVRVKSGLLNRYELEKYGLSWNPARDSGAFQGYMGDYFLYYLSTSNVERGRPITGEMHVEPEEDYCGVKLKIHAGYGIQKEYKGQVVASQELKVGYMLFFNPESGELSTMYIRYRRFHIRDVWVKVGLFLTVSAGDVQFPTVGYILLTRDKIDRDRLETVITPFLWICAGDDFLVPDKAPETDVVRNCDIIQNRSDKITVRKIDRELLIRQLLCNDREEEYLQAAAWLRNHALNLQDHVVLDSRVDEEFYYINKLLQKERKDSSAGGKQ